MKHGRDLGKTAARFDELYTEMTGLQRELIQAVRDDLDGRAAEDLEERASTILVAARVAETTLQVGCPDVRAVEAAALRSRILVAPAVEGVLGDLQGLGDLRGCSCPRRATARPRGACG